MIQFSWDEKKNQKNYEKHGIRFEDAAKVFDDKNAIMIMGEIIDNEERWRTVGMVNDYVIVLVAHTYFDEDDIEYIRIISARRMENWEVQKYGYR